MANFTITINNKLSLAALTDAVNEYNNRASTGGPRNRPSNAPTPTPLDEEEFLQMLIDRQLQKYVAQFKYDVDVDTQISELTALKAKITNANK